MKNKIHPIKVISTQDQDTLQIRFFPTDICNFSCSYCFPGSGNINKYRYPKNIDTVIKNFRTLFDKYTERLNKTKFHLIIIGGGEPTMWPHIEQFCKEIRETHNVFITICSNGSRTLRWWDENSAYFDAATLSCHHEFVDIDHYIDVADLLFSRGIKVNGLMLMDAPHWDKCVDYVNRMQNSKESWFIEVKAVVDAPGHGMDAYTQEQLTYLKNGLKRMPDSSWLLPRLHELRPFESILLFDDGSAITAKPHDLIVNEWNKFQGWKCNVALETLFINYDGIITGGCQEPVFSGKTFNIFSETFIDEFNLNVNFEAIICPKAQCSCQPETHVTKSLV
jgi:organic radical activating enzyme